MVKTSVYSKKLDADIEIQTNMDETAGKTAFVSYLYPDGHIAVQDWSQGYWNRDIGDYWNRSW